ncbi:PREDICTED: uncharacterized protein LOC105313383 [Amphimedon queenslandica]|uniref:Integrator complex subunit 5 C-terminal domain-containing protein n=1 Tax=Amphimedon queenslandica TaxID=400682 RepID=A0A1X7VUF6_AMPQE|nr:PREDICTED: uncharacterized protein LOC105313383 [Amphimedon queenslandica]|eukprot:XP_011405071.1 PREDICTED: uncharacterized protein LOC105313383 [Amphimedon queenslandica]
MAAHKLRQNKKKSPHVENRDGDSEIDQTLKTLQKPAACNFILSMVERYIRSLSSPDLVVSSLPNKEKLLSLIDSYILLVPTAAASSSVEWPFNVFEELELLEALRGQVEERQLSKEIQLALFDTLFGLADDDEVASAHRLSLLKKLVSLSISGLGNGTVLHCTTYWMELYPIAAAELATNIYSEFCELLPNAMEPLLALGNNCPSFTKLLILHLTSSFPISSSSSIGHASCPPLRCIHLLSQWILTNPDSLTTFPDTRDSPILIRSQRVKRPINAPPLMGVAQWVILEPLIPDQWIVRNTERRLRGRDEEKQLVTEYRSSMSQLHANLLTYLMSLSSSPVHIAMTSTSLSSLVGRLLEFQQKTATLLQEEKNKTELSLERLSQFLQIGLDVGIVSLNPDFLTTLLSTLPKNRLLNIVVSHHRKGVTYKN